MRKATNLPIRYLSYFVVVVVKVNVARPLTVGPNKLGVSRWTLILGIASQHALETHANTLDILYGAPALGPEEVKANNAIGIDVRMYGYRSIGKLLENNFRRFCVTGKSTVNQLGNRPQQPS